MHRTLLAAAILAGGHLSADEPKPIDEPKRQELVKQWREKYDAAAAVLQGDIEAATAMTKIAASAAEGKRQLARATRRLQDLRKDPFSVLPKLLWDYKPGQAGLLPWTATVVKNSGEAGLVLDVVIVYGPRNSQVLRVELIDVHDKVAKGDKFTFKGPHVLLAAGGPSPGRTPWLTVQRLEVKPEEMPK